MTGKGWVWLGSDGLTSVTPTKQTKTAEAMLGSVGIMPTGTLHFNSVTLSLPQVIIIIIIIIIIVIIIIIIIIFNTYIALFL